MRQEKLGKRSIWVATLRTPRSRVPLDLVWVPPGSFTAGKEGQNPDETARPATVARGFWIGRTEVPAQAFEDYEDAVGLPRLPGGERAHADVPLADVSWLAAQLFLEWLGARFPTETEWEWAARGDTDRDFPWTPGAPDPGNVDHGAAGAVVRSRSYPQDVSPFGLFDMGGNVSEWCQEESTRGRAVDADVRRVARARNFRGGNFHDDLIRAKLWKRHGGVETDGDHRVGLRLVKHAGASSASPPAPPPAAPGVTGVTLRPLPWRRAAWVGVFTLGGALPVEVAYVPPCVFAMGQRHGRTRPPQQVQIEEGFWIARTETTIEAWQRHLESTNATGVRKPDASKLHHPITLIQFDDLRGFLDWAQVRLPTEAEWELAARSRDGRSFPWGEALVPGLARVRAADGRNEGPAEVATHPLDVSPFGLFDVTGNVHEWVSDVGDAPATRLLKGGACVTVLESSRLWLSRPRSTDKLGGDIGFRFVVGRGRGP